MEPADGPAGGARGNAKSGGTRSTGAEHGAGCPQPAQSMEQVVNNKKKVQEDIKRLIADPNEAPSRWPTPIKIHAPVPGTSNKSVKSAGFA